MNALLLSLLLHTEPKNGAVIPVEVRVGTVTVEVQARLIPCARDRRCAQLPSGRRVAGRIEDGRFVVEGAP